MAVILQTLDIGNIRTTYTTENTGSAVAANLYQIIKHPIKANLPLAIGLPSEVAQSSYYPRELRISQKEILMVSKVFAKLGIDPGNSRL
jgi:dipeptidyl-peptidase-3